MIKVLLIDDEDDFREVMVDRLTHEGFEVYEALDGAMGIEMARVHRPDIVLLDLMMPVMNGYRVWSFFQKEEVLKEIPVLILTAKLHANDIYWGERMPAIDYLNKSLKMEHVLMRIRQKIEEFKEERIFKNNNSQI